MRCAFFDFDGTVRAHDSIVSWVLFALRRVKMPLSDGLSVLVQSALCLLARRGKPETLKTLALRFEQRLSEAELDALIGAFIRKKILPRLRRDALRAVEDCRGKGYRVVLVSASTEDYMPAAAEALRADGLICTRIENGTVQTNCRGAEKVRRIRAWAEEQPEAIDFARSRAYGDTAGDLPMLRLVGEGFAVNPKRKLRRAAKKENIPILRWR